MTLEACTCQHRPCGACQRPMRAFDQRKVDHPTTVAIGARGLCSSCTHRVRRGLPGAAQPKPNRSAPRQTFKVDPADVARAARTQPRHGGRAALSEDDYARRACADIDPELFFSPEGERGQARADRVDAAKKVCAGCPVRMACLDVALTNREAYGVFGGLDEDERASILRRAARKRRAVA